MENVTFETLHAALASIDYSEEWANGTGYLDGAVHEDLCLHGETVASETPDGRKIIIHATKHGNVVLFQRYSDNANVIVYNVPRELNLVINLITGYERSITVDHVLSIIGNVHQPHYDKFSTLHAAIEKVQYV